MDKDAKEDFSLKQFTVFPAAPNEEYILSDTVTSGSSLTSRFDSLKEQKPEPRKISFDIVGDVKPSLEKLVTDVRIKSDAHFEEDFPTAKVKSKWDDIGIEEELLQFCNNEEINGSVENESTSFDIVKTVKVKSKWDDIGIEEELLQFCNNEEINGSVENESTSFDIVKTVKRDEQHQGVKSRHFQTSGITFINSMQHGFSGVMTSDPFRDCTQRETEISAKPHTHHKRIANCKTSKIETDTICEKHSQSVRNQNNTLFSNSSQPVTANAYSKNLVRKEIHSCKQSSVVSSDINLLRNFMKSAHLPNEPRLNKAKKNNGVELEIIQMSDDPKKEVRNTNNCDNAVNPYISVICHAKNICNTDKISKNENVTETEVIEISEDSREEYLNENRCDRVTCNNLLCNRNITEPTDSNFMKLSSFVITVCDSTKTSTHDLTNVCQSKIHSNILSQYENHSDVKEMTCKNNSQNNEAFTVSSLPDNIDSEGKFVCQKCSKSFNFRSLLNKHLQAHSEEKKFICKDCCNAYTTKAALDDHIFSGHNPSARKHQCNKCSRFFPNEVILQRHIKKSHSKTKIKMPETCDICQKVYQERRHLLEHKSRIHNIHGKKLICNECSAEFSNKFRLVDHIKTLHMPPELKCSLCSEYFHTKMKLRLHLRKDHGEDKRQYLLCETCGKTSKCTFSHEQHLRSHSENKDYICEDCGKSFRTVSNLKQHSRIHSDIRPFCCDICNKSFRIRHHLRQHMAVHGLASVRNYNKTRGRSGSSKVRDDKESSSFDDSSE